MPKARCGILCHMATRIPIPPSSDIRARLEAAREETKHLKRLLRAAQAAEAAEEARARRDGPVRIGETLPAVLQRIDERQEGRQ